jgi:hypothetical protein
MTLRIGKGLGLDMDTMVRMQHRLRRASIEGFVRLKQVR